MATDTRVVLDRRVFDGHSGRHLGRANAYKLAAFRLRTAILFGDIVAAGTEYGHDALWAHINAHVTPDGVTVGEYQRVQGIIRDYDRMLDALHRNRFTPSVTTPDGRPITPDGTEAGPVARAVTFLVRAIAAGVDPITARRAERGILIDGGYVPGVLGSRDWEPYRKAVSTLRQTGDGTDLATVELEILDRESW